MKARRIVNDPVGVGLFNRQVLSRAITPVYGYTKKIQPVVDRWRRSFFQKPFIVGVKFVII